MAERKLTAEDNTAEIEKIVDKIETKGWTPNQEHFGEWIAEKSGIEFTTAKARAEFVRGARYALALRYEHQRSPEAKEAWAERRAAREEEAAARPKRAPKVVEVEDEAPAPKRRPGRPAKVVEDEAPAAPVRRGRRAAAASAPASETSAPVKPGRRPAAAGRARRGANKAEADF